MTICPTFRMNVPHHVQKVNVVENKDVYHLTGTVVFFSALESEIISKQENTLSK
jgi:hypothetical protein